MITAVLVVRLVSCAVERQVAVRLALPLVTSCDPMR